MKIISIMDDTLIPTFKKVKNSLNIDLTLYSSRSLNYQQDLIGELMKELYNADLIIINRTNYTFWDSIIDEIAKIGEKTPLICLGTDISYFSISSVDLDIVNKVYSYLTYGGYDNIEMLFKYLLNIFNNDNFNITNPIEIPWQGIFHPKANKSFFNTLNDYIKWYNPDLKKPWVGIIASRSIWISGDLEIDNQLISDLENEGLNVLPVFTNIISNKEINSLGIDEIIKTFFIENSLFKVKAIIKLTSYMFSVKKAVNDFLEEFNIPIFQPIITSYASIEEWKDMHSLGSDITWSIVMPEYEGIIEPLFLGSSHRSKNEDYNRISIHTRSKKIAKRIKNWINLIEKPKNKRKVVFILNNNPCSSLEGSIGGASNLDSLESVVNILKSMKREGYDVNPPKSSKELIKLFLDKKAISEFRWTSKSEILASGGAIYLLSSKEYMDYFNTFSLNLQKKIIKFWGEPPGEGMVLNNNMIITGLLFNNVIVAVQPKRGCFGSRCDGEVCKILHDPECPPTHQYLGSYYYFNHIFNGDIIVHVGTHGNTEFLPGKGNALSDDCFPDVVVSTKPILYIYNTDNPSEGVIAKRRVYSPLIGHMQTVFQTGSLYEKYAELDELLTEYETIKMDSIKQNMFRDILIDKLKKANFNWIDLNDDSSIEDIISKTHENLSLIRNTQIQKGLHIFGNIPTGEDRIDFISSVIRFDSSEDSPRRIISKLLNINFDKVVKNQDNFSKRFKMSYGAILECIDKKLKVFISSVINNEDISNYFNKTRVKEHSIEINKLILRIKKINESLNKTNEINSLLNGLDGGYIKPGPSGHISRGHEDVLPTGRNFYSFDSSRLPTKTAWIIGKKLANELVNKYFNEEGKYPESVGLIWNSSDLLTSGGEMMGQMMALMGVEPVWDSNGKVSNFKIIRSDDLKYPRVDITVKISGIMRDNFKESINFLDDIITVVSNLDEPNEINKLKKHVLLDISKNNSSFIDATSRFFSSKPGVYSSGGVNLAILASAWKKQEDLSKIYIYTNGYAYGGKRNGKEAHEQFISNLSKISITFNKISSDETDLLGCSCYFGTHGGITAAANHITGNKIKIYYGDTREPSDIKVRNANEEIARVSRSKLLNPKWIEAMKKHGYKGASDIMKRVTYLYGWEASCEIVDDWIFDELTDKFVLNQEMNDFFKENNPYALEEISRRLLEANSRGLWNCKDEILGKLQYSYIETESWLEEEAGEGEFQGGSVDVIDFNDILDWGNEINNITKKINKRINDENTNY